MRTKILQVILVIGLATCAIDARPHVDEQPLKFSLDTEKEVEGVADNTERPVVKITANTRLQDGMVKFITKRLHCFE